MSFRAVIGQGKAINILCSTISRNRVPSSYLFAGESGIGKKFTAVNLAKTLNCQNTALKSGSAEDRASELPIDCCDECHSCKKIDSQTHPDFLMITPEKAEIRVDEIRAVEDALSLMPYEGKRKVVIVDDAETMNPSAANAFLKTLEEPPPQSVIILISASPDRMPETIRSRCARINFSPLSPEACEEAILKARGVGTKGKGQEEGKNSQVATIARLSMGRPGLAVINDLIEDRDWFVDLFHGMMSGADSAIWTDKEEIEKWINFSFILLRDLAVFKITGDVNMLINMDMRDNIVSLCKTVGIKDIIETYFKLSLIKNYLGFNLNKAITWNYIGFILKEFKRGIQDA